MNRYLVFRKSDNAQVYDYEADLPVEWAGYEFATHDHVLQEPAVDPEAPPPTVYGGRRILSQVEFLRLLTQAERIGIRQFAKGDSYYAAAVADYMAMVDAANEINLDDDDMQQGIPMLEQLTLLAAGRAGEILNG